MKDPSSFMNGLNLDLKPMHVGLGRIQKWIYVFMHIYIRVLIDKKIQKMERRIYLYSITLPRSEFYQGAIPKFLRT